MLLRTISNTNLTIPTFFTLNEYIDYFHKNNPNNLDPKVIEIHENDILFKIDEYGSDINSNIKYKIFRVFYKYECFWYTSLIFKEI